jgi:hypothetical protein
MSGRARALCYRLAVATGLRYAKLTLRPDKGANMLCVDLKAAGIPYQDVSGQFFDFHALRCELADLADAAGVSPRLVHGMMRQSTLELTGRYTKPRDRHAVCGVMFWTIAGLGRQRALAFSRASDRTYLFIISRPMSVHLGPYGHASTLPCGGFAHPSDFSRRRLSALPT